MISPKELRIGNYYQPTDGSGAYAEVTVDDFVAWNKGARYGKYIPLTEEWLVGLGGRPIGGGIYGFDEYWVDIENFSPPEFGILGAQNLCVCEYVHHLQNLILDLEGRLLTIQAPRPLT